MKIIGLERRKADELGVICKSGFFESLGEVKYAVEKQFKGFPPYLGCEVVDGLVIASFKLWNEPFRKSEEITNRRTPKFVKWLKDNNLSYSDFGKMVGVHKTTVCRWANCKTVPNEDYKKKIRKAIKDYEENGGI